jgi:predicted nucleotide-binding protein
MTDDELELLHRAHDTFERLGDLSTPYAARSSVQLYERSISSLLAAGFDVQDLVIPRNFIDADGEIVASSFRAIVRPALGYTERELARREQSHSRLKSPKNPEPREQEPNSVFVVHGQDQDAFETMFALLREVELLPRAFSDARRLTASPMPYIGEVLSAAFAHAQAVLVLFTPDERVELKDRLRGVNPIQVDFQPRPNVLIEAGIALTTHPNRTVIVEMGNVRPISDLSGRHVVRWREDGPAARSELLDRLEEAGCRPNREGNRWMEVAKKERPTWL